MDGDNYVNLAYHLAVVAHDGQYRKGSGEPYINHAEAVAGKVFGWERKTIALLHDVIEDTSITAELLYQLFPGNIVDSVIVLTRDPWDPMQQTYMEYIDLIIASGNEKAVDVKLADLTHNLEDLSQLDPEHASFLRKRYTRAQAKIIENRWKEV